MKLTGLLLFLLLLVPGRGPGGPRGAVAGGCGIPAQETVEYDSFPADTFFAEPRVVAISSEAGRESIRIGFLAYSDEYPAGREMVVMSEDEGLTWRESEVPPATARDVFGRGPFYRIAGRNDLQRSTDGLDWTHPHFKIDGVSIREVSASGGAQAGRRRGRTGHARSRRSTRPEHALCVRTRRDRTPRRALCSCNRVREDRVIRLP